MEKHTLRTFYPQLNGFCGDEPYALPVDRAWECEWLGVFPDSNQ